MTSASFDAFRDDRILGEPADPPPTWDEYMEGMDQQELLVEILRCLTDIAEMLRIDRARSAARNKQGPNYLSPTARADLDACDEYD